MKLAIKYEPQTAGLRVFRNSPFTGKENSMLLKITEEQLFHWVQSGWLVQDAFPQLNADEREFLINGISPQEWNAMFEGSDPEDDESEYSDEDYSEYDDDPQTDGFFADREESSL